MIRLYLATALVLAAFAPAAATEYRFPDDAGIIDVKRDFGAKGDGKTDDTAALKKAIQTALQGNYRNPRMVFLPAGTYLVSEPLKARVHDGPEDGSTWCNGWRCGLFLAGESRERTVIRLRDQCPGFGDPAKPQYMLATGSTGHGQGHDRRVGGWGNEAFQNTLMNFTIDSGKGNPGAMGVDFLASNRGTMEEISVRSGEAGGAGVCGIDLRRGWPGPALVKNCSVEGFDYGLRQNHMDCSMTYEHLTFTGQRVAAVAANNAVMSLRGIVSRNATPAFVIEEGSAMVSILDSTFTFTGKAAAPPAIVADCCLVLKNVAVDGYPAVVTKPGKDGKPASGVPALPMAESKGTVPLYSMRGISRVQPGDEKVPGLPVKETPVFHHNDFTKWANPHKYAAGSRTSGLQEAIDSGAEIVYLPNGTYNISETVVLRGKVRKVMGMEARFSVAKGVDPVIRFDGVDSGCAVLEHLAVDGDVEHNCDQTLSIRKCDTGYRNSIRGTGDVFLEDGMFDHPRILFPQKLWARQLNSEFGERPNFTNRGGTAWILGMKVEGWVGAILNVGGVTECYALYAMTGGGENGKKAPFLENREGWLAVSFRDGGQGNHFTKLKDTWDGATKQIDNWQREYCLAIGGQTFDPAALKPGVPGAAQAKALSHDRVELNWGSAESKPVALSGYRIVRNSEPVAMVLAGQTAFTDQGLKEKTAYAYEVSAVNLRGGVSAPVKVSVTTPADATAPTARIDPLVPYASGVLCLAFDEPMDTASVSTPTHYKLEPAVAIQKARSSFDGRRAILELAAPLVDGQTYTLTCPSLKDRSVAGNALAQPAIAFTHWVQGDGLKVEFWNDKESFEGKPVASRIDRRIDYWWGDGSPAPGVSPGAFCARWSGVLRPKVTGEYAFNTGVVSGARIGLDGSTIHDVWNGKHEWTWSGPVQLEAGKRYALVFETHAIAGQAGARLKWKGPGFKDSQFIDDEYLFSAAK
jgi:hypothetical protein